MKGGTIRGRALRLGGQLRPVSRVRAVLPTKVGESGLWGESLHGQKIP